MLSIDDFFLFKFNSFCGQFVAISVHLTAMLGVFEACLELLVTDDLEVVDSFGFGIVHIQK